MLNYVILVAALLPAIILLIIVLIRDKEHPEPTPWILKGLLYGVYSIFASLLVSQPLLALGLVPEEYTDALTATWHSFGAAAIPEESAKLLFLWLLLRKNPYFDEYFDGIVYAVCIGLGFAAFENVMYLFNAEDGWPLLAIMRGLLAVPAHFFFAVLMGYYYSVARFGHNPKRNYLMMWAVPVLCHGIYDAVAMTSDVSETAEGLLAIALLLFCNELRKLCQRHIKELLTADQSVYNKNPFA